MPATTPRMQSGSWQCLELRVEVAARSSQCDDGKFRGRHISLHFGNLLIRRFGLQAAAQRDLNATETILCGKRDSAASARAANIAAIASVS